MVVGRLCLRLSNVPANLRNCLLPVSLFISLSLSQVVLRLCLKVTFNYTSVCYVAAADSIDVLVATRPESAVQGRVSQPFKGHCPALSRGMLSGASKGIVPPAHRWVSESHITPGRSRVRKLFFFFHVWLLGGRR